MIIYLLNCENEEDLNTKYSIFLLITIYYSSTSSYITVVVQ
jgi:hypothetical protein